MSDRLAASRWIGACSLLLAVALGWRILILGLADHWAATEPQRALYWRGDQTEALQLAATTAFDSGHAVRATALARRGIAAYPLDGRNYRVLAALAQARGDAQAAQRMLAIARVRSPRDLRTRMALAADALQAGDADRALHQLDAILRIEPEEEPGLLPRIARLTEASTTTAAFVRMLSQRPPWRGRFLQTLAARERDPLAVARVYRALLASGPLSLSSDEIGYWVDRQVADGQWASARAAWASSLPIAQRGALGNLFDGRFAFPASDSGFGWRMLPVPGVQSTTTALAGSGHALTLAFEGMRVATTGVMQRMALDPGTYVLRGKARADALATGRGLQWMLACAEGHQQVLASSPVLIGSQGWHEFQVAFDVPSDDCGGQWLRLQPAVPDQIDGRAAYAELAVERLPSSVPAPPASPAQDDPLHAPVAGDRGDRLEHVPSLWALFMGEAVPACAAIVCRTDADAIGLP